MYDAVFAVAETVECHTELTGVACEGVYLVAAHRVSYGLVLVHGGYVVVGRAVGAFGTHDLETALAKSFKRLRRGHLMAVVAVDIKLVGTVFDVVDHMGIPDFVKQCLCHVSVCVVLCWF